jgi:predicted HAD superfamily Cof-like phosphohydrolase
MIAKLHQAANQAANQPLVLDFLQIHPSQSLMIRVEKVADSWYSPVRTGVFLI